MKTIVVMLLLVALVAIGSVAAAVSAATSAGDAMGQPVATVRAPDWCAEFPYWPGCGQEGGQ